MTPHEALRINDLEYLEMPGLNVMLAHDFYPDGHQSGLTIIQNGCRVAANGDVRLDSMPGQWSPIPKAGKRVVDRERNEVRVRMQYPDPSRDRTGFNPINYPDLEFAYTIRVQPEGDSFRVAVDLERPLPPEWLGKVSFSLELFPASLFGKSYACGSGFGVFPRQAGGDGLLAHGSSLVVASECDAQRITIERLNGGEIRLIDGRAEHNNGWFVVASGIESAEVAPAVEWRITANALPAWKHIPVIQVSQVGYHPDQEKIAVIELDHSGENRLTASLLKVGPKGLEPTLTDKPREWGDFLRYRYLHFDFTQVREPGIYVVTYGDGRSEPFRIASDIFSHGVWQPTVEYFLPIQMCHMRVNENYRCWHGACHLDDATMAPTDLNHLDGYVQGPTTLTRFQPGEHVPGLDRGGWHDAGDFDIRVESQAHTVHGLALAYEQFGLTYDNTTVDQEGLTVELLRPDGIPDILQQVEHGCLAIVGGWKSLGRLYRGVIESTRRQYVHLGDAMTVTDNVAGSGDDRWVFTEQNPKRELTVAAGLAAASRVLQGINDSLAQECLGIAITLHDNASPADTADRIEPVIELLQTTQDPRYSEFLKQNVAVVAEHPDRLAWLGARATELVGDAAFTAAVREVLAQRANELEAAAERTPYGVPFEPAIWGAAWNIQRFGVRQYWLNRAFPDLYGIEPMLHTVSYVLGCHPGSNTASLVSGVGAKSMIPGYGVNRADESYIPGGVASGTALIRPDFPELLEWPYLWQQTEYCLGYPTSDFVFLVAAADHLLSRGPKDRSQA